MRVIVVIRARNAKKYLGKCLRSLMAQTFKKWEAFVVLDAPDDGTPKVLAKYTKQDKRIHGHINPNRLGLGQNMYFAITEAARVLKPDDKDVFAVVDGDDWLAKTALIRVARAHKKDNCLLTYGSYMKMSKGKRTRVSKKYPGKVKVRKWRWRSSHLKTAKWLLLKHIKEKWFQHKGHWLPAASDMALMIPLLEMAGLDRSVFIRNIIYYYRDNTGHNTKRITQRKYAGVIRRKKKEKRV